MTTPTLTWTPLSSDKPNRGNISVHGCDPESWDTCPGTVPANQRTLFCRDEAHGLCTAHGAKMRSFDFQFRRPMADPCGCSCHH